MRKVLGIDPGKAETGWGVINEMNHIDHGVIRTSSELNTPERLRIIFNETLRVIRKYEPEFLSVEKLYFFKNRKTAMGVSEARGVVLAAGARKELEIYGFTPLQVKMTVTGYGKASKKQVQEMVKKLLKMEETPKPNDAADALAVAICCIRDLDSNLKQKTRL